MGRKRGTGFPRKVTKSKNMGNKDLHNEEDFAADDLFKNGLKFKSRSLKTDKGALWAKIKADVDKETPIRSINSGRRRWIYYIGAAASVAVVLFFIFSRPDGLEKYQAAMASNTNFTLPDDSQVVLNANSKIRYDGKRWEEKRALRLEGEAFFDVERGKVFEVQTPKGIVTVLGTEFNVFARPAGFKVTCQEGRVSVSVLNGATEIITAGQGVELVGERLQRFDLTSEAAAPWVNGIFDYDQRPISEIIDEIERQYDVTINYPKALADQLITSRFTKTDNLEEALEDIIYAHRLEYEKDRNTVQLK